MATSKERAFARKVRTLVAQAGEMQDDGVVRVIRLLAAARKEVAARVASTDWQAYHLPQLKTGIERALQDFGRQYGVEMREMQRQFWDQGIDMTDLPLREVGIAQAIPEIDVTALSILQDYSADLVEGVTGSAVRKINNEITLGLMGGKSPFDVMGAVGRNLNDKSIFKSIAQRAETIVRTEAGRVLEAAGQARKEAAAKVVPGLQKVWHYGHTPRQPRVGHMAIHGQVRNVDKPFDVAGEKLMYPKDPAGSAKNTIKCGCISLPHHPRWDDLDVAAPQWQYIDGSQKGSNPGGQFRDPEGKLHYVKFYEDPLQARSEYLAHTLATRLGLGAPKASLRVLNWQGSPRLGVATEWIEDTVPIGNFINKRLPELQRKQLARHYLGAALMGNRDVVGAGFENLVRFGRTWRCIDQGGALRFRAQGMAKEFGADVPEFESLLAPGRKAGQVFKPILGPTLKQHPDEYIEWLQKLTDPRIKAAVKAAGLDAALADTLIARREALAVKTRQLAGQSAAVFKDAGHQALYDRLLDEYQGLEAGDLRKKFRSQCVACKTILDDWRGSTQRLQPSALKMKAEMLEARELTTFTRSGLSREELLQAAAMIPDEEYIRIRAMNQAYYQTLGIGSRVLYRGTDGNRSGPKYRRAVQRLRAQNPGDWDRLTLDMKETALTGWSTDRDIAEAFGHGRGGITVTLEVPAEEILLDHDIWPKNSFMNEREHLVLGMPVRRVPVGSIIL